MIWTDQLQWAAVSTKRARVRLPWNQRVVALPDMRARFGLGETIRTYLKTQPDHRRRRWFQQLLSELGNPPEPDRQMLSWDEVRSTMHLARIGGHTHTHPILSRIDRDGCNLEISMCKQRIEEETGCSPAFFAYPNGRDEDYTQETKNVLRRHGFKLAFSTCEGVAGPDSDWLAVKRLPASGVRTTLQAHEARQQLPQAATDSRLIGIQ